MRKRRAEVRGEKNKAMMEPVGDVERRSLGFKRGRRRRRVVGVDPSSG